METLEILNDEETRQRLVNVMRDIVVEVTELEPEYLEADTYLFPEIAEGMGVDIEKFGVKTHEEVSLDSLDMLDILVGVEDLFDIEIDMEQLESGEIDAMQFSTLATTATFLMGFIEPDSLQAGIAKHEERAA